MVLHLSISELLTALSDRLHKIVPFELAMLSLHDSSRNMMRVHFWEGNQVGLPAEVPVDEAPGGWAWRNQLPLVIPNLEEETRFPKVSSALREKGLKSFCMLPLTTAQTRFGGLGIGSSSPDAYQETDVRFLRRVAKLVALVLENSFIRDVLHREKAA